MKDIDRTIINHMQSGFPVCSRPFAEMAKQLSITENELINHIKTLLDNGTLSRFGPLYDIEKIGGIYSLVTMQVPSFDVERVIKIINSYQEVAHHYERDHQFNLWFVIAIDLNEDLPELLKQIEKSSGYQVYNMPKLDEFYVGLKFDA